MLTVNETIKECRAEAKKHGLTFKKSERLTINGSPAYLYAKRGTGEMVRSNLTLSLAFEIACSGELAQYGVSPTATKFRKAIEAVAQNYDDQPERTTSFVNAVSMYANKKFKLNAAATTYEQNCFIDALDQFFN